MTQELHHAYQCCKVLCTLQETSLFSCEHFQINWPGKMLDLRPTSHDNTQLWHHYQEQENVTKQGKCPSGEALPYKGQ